MTKFKPKDPAYAAKIRNSFAQQGVMQTMGATLVSIQPGEVEIAFDYDWHQPHEILLNQQFESLLNHLKISCQSMRI